MLEKITGSVFSALIGACVAAVILWSFGNKAAKQETHEIRNLSVVGRFAVCDPETGKELVVIDSGSIMAANKVIATQFFGSQVAGSVMVGNRIYTTPDNLVETPAGQWRFFTEIGGDLNKGGELLVRSPQGWSAAGKETVEGNFARVGYNQQDLFQILAFDQSNKEVRTVTSEMPRRRGGPGNPGPGSPGPGGPDGPGGEPFRRRLEPQTEPGEKPEVMITDRGSGKIANPASLPPNRPRPPVQPPKRPGEPLPPPFPEPTSETLTEPSAEPSIGSPELENPLQLPELPPLTEIPRL